MAKRAFWPGFRWRILAHELDKPSGRGIHTGKSLDLQVPGKPNSYPGLHIGMDGPWEFDELCIDDWFHLEQMNERDWWLGVGNGDDYWHVNIHIDRDGKATVQMEKQ